MQDLPRDKANGPQEPKTWFGILAVIGSIYRIQLQHCAETIRENIANAPRPN